MKFAIPQARTVCIDKIAALSGEWVVEIKPKETKRSLEQNARMWAMLSDIACQVDWYGKRRSAEDWKHMFTAALYKHEAVPGIDGGFVVLGLSTSRMSTKQMSDLMEFMSAFGIERGVKFTARGYEGGELLQVKHTKTIRNPR